MGVKTGAAAFCFWQLDPSGISLWLDVRNGGNGVLLGTRTLEAATLVTCTGEPGESAFALAQRLCRAMAQGTAVPAQRGGMLTHAIYGSNDWYYSYGHNTPDGILRDADLVASLSPSGPVRPFSVIDDGYQDPARFPSLPRLASAIRSRGVTPGLWIRPLRAPSSTPAKLLLPDARLGSSANREPLPAYDPTLPEAMERIAAVADEACRQGFDLIKHDFTTYELFGQWGSQMGASPTGGSWHFYDRTLTNAEVVALLYRRLRLACGPDRLILGCNTVGHLSVGLFDACRTGDDVSGRLWERTRRTGVNTLAFRLPQHRAFFALDADCVPITPDVPWSLTRQWLDAVAGTGTVLLISPDPRSVSASTGQEGKEAIRAAFARCLQAADDSSDSSATEPLDWLTTRTPCIWSAANRKQEHYAWIPEDGAPPFPIGIQRGPA